MAHKKYRVKVRKTNYDIFINVNQLLPVVPRGDDFVKCKVIVEGEYKAQPAYYTRVCGFMTLDFQQINEKVQWWLYA